MLSPLQTPNSPLSTTSTPRRRSSCSSIQSLIEQIQPSHRQFSPSHSSIIQKQYFFDILYRMTHNNGLQIVKQQSDDIYEQICIKYGIFTKDRIKNMLQKTIQYMIEIKMFGNQIVQWKD